MDRPMPMVRLHRFTVEGSSTAAPESAYRGSENNKAYKNNDCGQDGYEELEVGKDG
jgi:hypothetical protein